MRKAVAQKSGQAAIAAVAQHFSATWQAGNDEGNTGHLTIAGRRIALDVAVIGQRLRAARPVRPRLRFDKVVFRLLEDLQTGLRDAIPQGQAVILTVTAPIKLPGRTALALEARIRRDLAGKPAGRSRATVHGNGIRLHRLADVPAGMPKLVGFVHNADTDPAIILEVTEALMRHIGARAAARPVRASKSECWLILANEAGLSHLETYRQIWERIAIPTGFAKILLVLAGGRVEMLQG